MAEKSTLNLKINEKKTSRKRWKTKTEKKKITQNLTYTYTLENQPTQQQPDSQQYHPQRKLYN